MSEHERTRVGFSGAADMREATPLPSDYTPKPTVPGDRSLREQLRPYVCRSVMTPPKSGQSSIVEAEMQRQEEAKLDQVMRIVASQAAGATTKLPFTLDTDDNGDYIRFFNGREPIHGAGVATFLHTQVIAAAAAQERADKEVLYCDGHSETRFVHYRNDFDDSYCYTELEEGYNDLHTLHVAQVYDDDFEKWHGLAAQPKEQQPTQGGKETE